MLANSKARQCQQIAAVTFEFLMTLPHLRVSVKLEGSSVS